MYAIRLEMADQFFDVIVISSDSLMMNLPITPITQYLYVIAGLLNLDVLNVLHQ